MRLLITALCFSQCFWSTHKPQLQGHGVAWLEDAPVSRGVASDMILIRGGTFEMGIDGSEVPRFQKLFGIDAPQLFEDEIPKHRVTIHNFYIDKNLVSNSQFKEFVTLNQDWKPGRIPPELDNGNYLKHWKAPASIAARPDHPVVNVNWHSAVAYCQWAGKRLPTEAEWEYAARGGLHDPFPWGAEYPDSSRANFSASRLHSTSRVGAYSANAFGIFDMAGNVWQFLADEWKRYAEEDQADPVAGGNSFRQGNSYLRVRTRRVIRGGSYDGAPVNLWVEYRDSHPPNGSQDFVGFRCAK